MEANSSVFIMELHYSHCAPHEAGVCLCGPRGTFGCAIRCDSAILLGHWNWGEYVMWNAAGNKFISSKRLLLPHGFCLSIKYYLNSVATPLGSSSSILIQYSGVFGEFWGIVIWVNDVGTMSHVSTHMQTHAQNIFCMHNLFCLHCLLDPVKFATRNIVHCYQC